MLMLEVEAGRFSREICTLSGSAGANSITGATRLDLFVGLGMTELFVSLIISIIEA